MEKSLNNALDELNELLDSIEEAKTLECLSAEIMNKCKTRNELKSNKALVDEFNDRIKDVNEISSFISEIIKNETEI